MQTSTTANLRIPSSRAKRVYQVCHPPDDLACNYSIFTLQQTLGRAGMTSLPNPKSRLYQKLAVQLTRFGLVRNVVRLPRKAVFAQVHRMSAAPLFPAALFYEPIIYAWDCWPYRYPEWERFIKRYGVKLAFISARQSVQAMQDRLPKTKFIWLPEATEAGDHIPDAPLKDRSIDVLELGRQYIDFHVLVTDALAAAGKKHLYERRRWQGLFPGREDLARGYADTKISVCFPASMSHPEWAGGVETATLRYFESLASKCLVYGHAPAELVDLFGYNPIIEADFSNPAAQLIDILANIERYQELVDRNYNRFLQIGTWECRAKQVVGALFENGYRI